MKLLDIIEIDKTGDEEKIKQQYLYNCKISLDSWKRNGFFEFETDKMFKFMFEHMIEIMSYAEDNGIEGVGIINLVTAFFYNFGYTLTPEESLELWNEFQKKGKELISRHAINN